LNVCVGGKNYKSFFIYVTSTLLATISYMCVTLYLLSDSFQSGSSYTVRHLPLERPALNLVGYQVALCVITFLLLIALGLLAHLFGFHIMLNCRKMSTYDWIIEQRELERAKEEEAMRRQQEIEQAQRNVQELSDLRDDDPNAGSGEYSNNGDSKRPSCTVNDGQTALPNTVGV
jgi:hypothetical protein